MGHFVWDWISCTFVDPVAFPSILDLHHDLDHKVTYAYIVKTAPHSLARALSPPISVSIDYVAACHPVTPVVSVFSAPPPIPPALPSVVASTRHPLRSPIARRPRRAKSESVAATLPTLAHARLCAPMTLTRTPFHGRSLRFPTSMRPSIMRLPMTLLLHLDLYAPLDRVCATDNNLKRDDGPLDTTPMSAPILSSAICCAVDRCPPIFLPHPTRPTTVPTHVTHPRRHRPQPQPR